MEVIVKDSNDFVVNAIDEQDIFYQNLVEADQLTEQLNIVSQVASQNTIQDIRSAKSAIYNSCLTKLVGKEDPVELDSSLTLGK
ncbi:4049_t:CDS:2 [Entrophospora sp. SA101]|nr:4049_t:CDS:2 [Entrophospora sp. SA101]